MGKFARLVVVVVVIVAAVVSLLLVLKYRGSKNNGDVKTAVVGRGNIAVVVTATGTLSPLKTVQVGSQISGTIAELRADFNSRVRKGQLIALLDTTFLVASVRDAEASVQRSRAQSRQAEIELERARSLAQKDLVSKLELETATVSHENAMASLKSAEAQLDRSQINLKYATIRAPIDGVVVSRNVDVGQTVAASFSAPTLFMIANDLKQMQLEANIDEADIGMIKVGQRTTFTVNAYPDDVFAGVVSQVRLESVTVQDVVNYVIIVAVSNPDEKLMPGMTATLSVNVDERDNVLKVPNMAFRFKPPEKLAGKTKGATRTRTGERSLASASQQNAGAASAGSQGGSQRGSRVRTQGGSVGAQGTAFGTQSRGGRQAQAPYDTTHRVAMTAKSQSETAAVATKLIWKMTKEGKLVPVQVRIGVTDGAFTEASSPGLAEGDAVAVGYSNPKQNQNTDAGRPRGGMFFGGH